MNDQVRIALLGSKFMGRAHSNAWSQVGRFFDLALHPVLHTVAARDAEALAVFAARWGWQHSTTDWRAAVESDEIDLVDIATPNSSHAEQAIAALAAGKHVVCEKPLAATLGQAEAMAAAARTSAGKTFVWFNYRRVPAIALAHQLVANGMLGQVFHARAVYLQSWGGPATPRVWRFDAEVAGSGAHGDLNAHIVDAVRFITGEEIVRVEGAIEQQFVHERALPDATSAAEIAGGAAGGGNLSAPSTVDDAVLFLARLSGGGVASFEASRVATGYHNANRIEIHGERAALRFDLERLNELGVYLLDGDGATQGWRTIDVTRGSDHHPYLQAWWPASHGLGYEHSFVNQAADMLAVLAGASPVVPLPDFEDALRTQQVLHAAILSARNHAPVAVPPHAQEAS